MSTEPHRNVVPDTHVPHGRHHHTAPVEAVAAPVAAAVPATHHTHTAPSVHHGGPLHHETPIVGRETADVTGHPQTRGVGSHR